MATANQMFERLERAVDRVFEDPARASVVLAHSARDLSQRYREITLPTRPSPDVGADAGGPDAPAAAQCAEWIAAGRKRALLASLGVGTIDQALLGVLPAAHQSLRLLGLGRRVLVLDEVHAYDEYMTSLVERLLAFQAARGGSVVLLSATLPHALRQRLADAYRRGLGTGLTPLQRTDDADYPLATHVHAGGVHETALERRPQAQRDVRVRRYTDPARVARDLAHAARDGQCAVWVRNTVADAVQGLHLVQNLTQDDPDVQVDLLHARLALGHRLDREAEILVALGPAAGHDQRRGRVVVATQVVEQSLDLDADLLVSDLAPVDLLVQRAGRLRRHVRDARGDRLPMPAGLDRQRDGRGEAVLGVLVPAGDTPDADWYARDFRGGAWVYPDHGRLWLSALQVPDGRLVSLPDDARALIRAVYGPDALGAIPPGLLPRTHAAQNQARIDGSTGSARALRLDDGYGSDDEPWTHDDAQRTRLGEPSVAVRLVELAGGTARPLVPHPRDPWAMSEVRVRRSTLATATVQPADRDAVARAQASMLDEGRYAVALPLRQNAEGVWQGRGTDGQGKPLAVRYSLETGLDLSPA